MQFFLKLIYINLQGFYHILLKTATYALHVFLSKDSISKIHISSIFIGSVLALQYWMGYNSRSLGNFALHGIFSEDYFLIIFLLGLLIAGALIRMFLKISRFWQNALKMVSLMSLIILTYIYIITFLYPERTTPASEARFTVWFYLFGADLAFIWATTVLGFKPSTD